MERKFEGRRRAALIALAAGAAGTLGIAGCTNGEHHTNQTTVIKSTAPTCDVSFAIPHTAGHSFADQKAAFQAALGQRESSNNWTAIQKSDPTYSDPDFLGRGAYMYSASSWKIAQQKAGYGSRYTTADVAPPAVQYGVARHDIDRILKVNKNWAQVDVDWANSIAWAKLSACNIPQSELNTANAVVKYMDQFLVSPGAIPPVAGLPVSEYNPALEGK